MIHPRDENIEANEPSAIFLSEYVLDINEGSGFLNALSKEDQKIVRKTTARSSSTTSQAPSRKAKASSIRAKATRAFG